MSVDEIAECGRSDAHEPHYYYAGIAGGPDCWVVQARYFCCLGHDTEGDQ